MPDDELEEELLLEEEDVVDPLEDEEDEVPQREAAEPEATQIIGTPLGSFKAVEQSAEPLPRHFIQGLLEGQVGTKPLVQ